MAGQKYYAVYNGREGTQIYLTWDEVRRGRRFVCVGFECRARGQPAPAAHLPPSAAAPALRQRSHSQSGILLAGPVHEIQLSPDQLYVLAKVKNGESVFFTGSAGTGKSVLLREIKNACGGRPSALLGVTASTGIASVNIGGCTLHSWAGIGLGKEDKDALVGKILGLNARAYKEAILERWRKVKTLIIDESACVLNEYIARKLRKNTLPFGGIQVKRLRFCTRALSPIVSPVLTVAWSLEFVDMLNAMRFGRLDEETTKAFYRLDREVKYDDGILPTELYPTRSEVESANSTRLERLPGRDRNYKALDAPGRDERGREYPPERVERALKDMIVPKQLPLKNIIQGLLVNGSVGRVVGFYKPREAGGQASAAGGAMDDPQREQKLKTILALNSVWPAVQFQQGPLMLCVPLSFEVVNADGNIEAVREQVPLILAWALSIHKSQGQTLERVRVDLNRTFEKGQGAHCKSSTSTLPSTSIQRSYISVLLTVNWIVPCRVRAHPRVLEWMAEHMDKVPDLPYIPDGEDEDVNELLDFWA
ncbi:PIF1-like helicase-domain-containing protein [Fomes fomentarius]|nr:PIF1-like helicase-domain-containing protein [Fomes fomentarius]